MILIHLCENCRKPNTLQFKASDRVELKRSFKSKLENIICNNCQHQCNVNVNNVRAREDQKLNSIIFLLGLFASLALGYSVIRNYWSDDIGISLDVIILTGGVLAVPQIIVAAFIQSNRKSVKLFNKHYV